MSLQSFEMAQRFVLKVQDKWIERACDQAQRLIYSASVFVTKQCAVKKHDYNFLSLLFWHKKWWSTIQIDNEHTFPVIYAPVFSFHPASQMIFEWTEKEDWQNCKVAELILCNSLPCALADQKSFQDTSVLFCCIAINFDAVRKPHAALLWLLRRWTSHLVADDRHLVVTIVPLLARLRVAVEIHALMGGFFCSLCDEWVLCFDIVKWHNKSNMKVMAWRVDFVGLLLVALCINQVASSIVRLTSEAEQRKGRVWWSLATHQSLLSHTTCKHNRSAEWRRYRWALVLEWCAWLDCGLIEYRLNVLARTKTV